MNISYKCPFCFRELTADYEYTNTAISCQNCLMHPYSRYSITLDLSNMVYWFSLLLEHESEIYAVSVRTDWRLTHLERLIKVTAPETEDYYLPVSIISVNTALPFDTNNPIKSGQEILQRLLSLRVFS